MHYFDNAATSWPKPECVYAAVEKQMRENGANPGRSGHCLAKQVDAMVEETRELLASFFNAPDPHKVVYTFNGTDGLNMVVKGLLKPGDHAVTTTVEHNSVSRPLRQMEREGVELSYLQADAEGYVSAEQLDQIMRPNTRLVILCHASNVLGAIQDIGSLSRVTHRHNSLLAVDAAQTAGFYPIDMQAMGIDILVVPGHKSLLGPFGTGAVITTRDVGIAPWRAGGTGTRSDARLHPEELPFRLEGGTLNAMGIAGLGAAVKFLRETGLPEIQKKEHEHIRKIIDVLIGHPKFILYGPRDVSERAALVSFNLQGMTSAELGTAMNDEFRIAGRPGLHCAPMAHRSAGTFPEGSYRLSPSFFTTPKEMEAVINALHSLGGSRV